MKNTLTATETELKIMTAALPVVEAVPASQDSCWPGDDPAHDDYCTETDHAASTAAVAATEGLCWEFSTWTATAAWFRAVIGAVIEESEKKMSEKSELESNPSDIMKEWYLTLIERRLRELDNLQATISALANTMLKLQNKIKHNGVEVRINSCGEVRGMGTEVDIACARFALTCELLDESNLYLGK
jgi:hypothetical protein